MGNADYKDRLAGSSNGVASSVPVGTAPVLVAPANDARISLTVQPDFNAYVGIASSFNATSACIAYVPSGALFEERDYRGDVWVKSEAATGVARRWEV